MPEIPEVEAFKFYIKKHCLHKSIQDVTSSAKNLIKGESFKQFKSDLSKSKFSHIDREGKYLVINISPSKKKLIMHFGLTGFLVYKKDKEVPVKFSRVTFIFNDGSVLHWNSIRKFGKIWLVKNINDLKELKNLGQDPLDLTKKDFLELMKDHETKNIKSFLMDQTVISGIGNEYSDEILFQAGIDPHRKVSTLSQKEREEMYKQMEKVLKYSIKLRLKHINKSPEQKFFSKKDSELFNSSYLQAHRHGDMLCPKNKNHRLKKEKISGRSAYYCPKDQK